MGSKRVKAEAPAADTGRLYTWAQFLNATGLSPGTPYNWERSGFVVPIKDALGRRCWTEEHVRIARQRSEQIRAARKQD